MNRFLTFASTHNCSPLPISEQLILRFIAYLHLQGLAPTTIKVYLAGLRAWVIALGFPEPTIWSPRVHLACRSISRDHPPPRQPAPITHHIISRMINSLTSSPDHLLIASAITLLQPSPCSILHVSVPRSSVPIWPVRWYLQGRMCHFIDPHPPHPSCYSLLIPQKQRLTGSPSMSGAPAPRFMPSVY